MKVFILLRSAVKYALMFFLSLPVFVLQAHGSMSPDDLLVSYSEKNNLTRSSGQDITINIYLNGDVSVSVSETMKHAGHYHAFLAQEKLDALWMLLVDEKILTFDAQLLREALIRERQLLKQSRAILTTVSDKAQSVLEFYPNRYSPPGLAGEDVNVVRRITWAGLRWDAEHYPQVEQLQLLYAIQKIVLSILNQDDLQRMDQ
ncbi:MAG: hypothetical protein H6937_05285 [Burkholderiales bacterium]|nr:hypothetical protein [Burkholderiales bacterium]MDR4517228.1 hypothetical protein [Nitrosomonas sp.]